MEEQKGYEVYFSELQDAVKEVDELNIVCRRLQEQNDVLLQAIGNIESIVAADTRYMKSNIFSEIAAVRVKIQVLEESE